MSDTNTKYPYVSIIKVNGKPILPPIVTADLRKELLRYKQQAVKLEQRLKHCRELKRNLDELLDAQRVSTRPESQLTYDDNSHIDDLNISDQKAIKHKNVQLTTDLIEVTEYNPHGLQTINSENNPTCDSELIYQKSCDRHRSASEPRKETELEKSSTPPKPRLIRSNSYTLESPSPILLDYFRKKSCTEFNNTVAIENKTGSSDFSSINTVVHNEILDTCDVASSPDKSAKDIQGTKSPTIEVYQTDISVQQITVNTSTSGPNGLYEEDKSKSFFTRNPFGILEPDSELLKVLKDIPATYANQIIELLGKQHIEQKERLERYDSLNNKSEKVGLNTEVFTFQDSSTPNQTFPLLQPQAQSECDNLIDLTSLSDNNLSKEGNRGTKNTRPNTTESFREHPSEKMRRSSTFSMSPSQSLYYSFTSDSDTLTTRLSPPDDCNKEENIEIGVLREKNGYWEGILTHDEENSVSCSRELFPEIHSVSIKALQQEWAASVIGAHVKGYLTRRLIKTDKVQILIATVKDVLMCALDLHQSDNIDEKDVELHRRLINQLSAALYSFHEIFFELSTAEQMTIIATDRQCKEAKLKRQDSGRSSARSKSSGRSDNSLNSKRSRSRHKLINELTGSSLTKV